MSAKKKIIGLVMALMALSLPAVWADNAVSPASSHQEGDWHHGKEGHMMAKILNLTETQEKQLNGIKQKQREAKKAVMEQIKANRVAFETEIVKATADMSKVNDLQTQLKTIQSQMVDNHLNFILDVKKLLTPEQFAGYMALEKAEDMMKMEHRHHFDHKDGAGKGDEGHEQKN